jgi:hypothetical protein
MFLQPLKNTPHFKRSNDDAVASRHTMVQLASQMEAKEQSKPFSKDP